MKEKILELLSGPEKLLAWLERGDTQSRFVCADPCKCVIAEYLKAHGVPHAAVDITVIVYGPNGSDIIPTPRWVSVFIRSFDLGTDGYKYEAIDLLRLPR